MAELSAWQRALFKFRPQLEGRLNIDHHISCLHEAVPGGFLTNKEEKDITSQPNDYSKVRKLIEILNTKDEKAFAAFVAVLKKAGLEEIAEELEKAAKEEYPASQGGSLVATPSPAGLPKKRPPVEHPTAQTAPRRKQTDDTDGPGENVQFVLITANKNEYVSLMSFLKYPNCKLQDPVDTTFADIVELKDRIKMKRSSKDYVFFSVRGEEGNVVCFAVMKCKSMGTSGKSGSRMETLKLLLTAHDQGWQPEAVFVIGCCGGRSVDGNTDVGTVHVSNNVIHYNKGKFEEELGIKWKPTTEYGSHRTTWCYQIQQMEDMQIPDKQVTYKEIDRFISGDYVVKSKQAAEALSGFSVNPSDIGIEMEGLGVAEAVKIVEMINDRLIKDTDSKVPVPEYVIVKGISDLAGHDKNEPCDIHYFGEKKLNVGEDQRQQMCTIMAATLVLRAIVHYS